MKTKFYLLSLLGAFLFFSCEQSPEVAEIINPPVEEELPPPVENPVITKSVFSGYAQKGPFINGSSVSIYELDSELNQTGRVYSTRITSNSGAFEQKNIELSSPYVELKADGYYFNEVSGKLSPGQITLYALVDIADINSANVNVLTHLAKSRIEYLVKEDKKLFADAKAQAEKEVLAIFDLQQYDAEAFEIFDLAQNALLITVASILQGYSATADVMQLMADISDDIQTDGKLSNMDLGSRLATNANALNLPKVRENLENKFAELNVETSIPDFESLVSQFLEKTSYKIGSLAKFPEFGNFPEYAPNLLAQNDTEFRVSAGLSTFWYPVAVEVPEGVSYRIVIRSKWTERPSGRPEYPYYIQMTDRWTLYDTMEDDGVNFYREFTLRVSDGTVAEFAVFFTSNQVPVTVECYENNSEEPTYVKTVKII